MSNTDRRMAKYRARTAAVPLWIAGMLLGVCVSRTHAQEGLAITGVVSDRGGAPVVGARVTATAEQGQSVLSTTTGAGGRYRLAFAALGRYRVRVEHAGFASPSREIEVSGTHEVNWSLEIAPLAAPIPFSCPGYTRLDGLVAYGRGPWRLALNLRNITDERYFDSSGFAVYYPSPPRQVFLSLNWQGN